MTTATESTVQLRPQPIGVFPFPAGLLLLPPAENSQQALDRLMSGDCDIAMPDEWRFFSLAVHGDIEGAVGAIRGDDAIACHNRATLGEFPLAEEASRRVSTRHAGVRAPLVQPEGEFLILRDAVAYATGQSEYPPVAEELDGELLAFVLMLHATRAMESSDLAGAMAILQQAIAAAWSPSPEFAAQLLGQLAVLERDSPAAAIQHYRDALALSRGPARADLSMQLGVALQDHSQGNRGMLLEAIKAYQDALRYGITLESQPEAFALLQNNLALAYLAMPAIESGDQLRMGIAVQSLREALKVYTKEAYPEEWASAQINLANALQYIPTSHPEENLMRAVEIYDEILNVRKKAYDPVGYARLLANQANALAHLGIFAPAMEKISEAYKLFRWHNEPEMAATAMSLVENISQQRGQANGSA